MKRIDLKYGYVLEALREEHRRIVYELCRRCGDYYFMMEGKEASYEDVQEMFDALPPGKMLEDKYLLGIYNGENELIGLVDLIKGFPEENTWMLGLMLISPDERGRGLGLMVHSAIKSIVENNGGKVIRIGVVKENIRGASFWSKLGYTNIKEIEMEFGDKIHDVEVMSLSI